MPPGNSQKIIVDALGLTSRRLWSIALSVVTGLVVARFLGPANYGLLAALSMIPSLALYGSLGWDQAARREILHLKGAGSPDTAASVRTTAYTAELVLAVGWMGVAMVLACTRPEWPVRAGILIGALWLIVAKLTALMNLDLFLAKDFRTQAAVGAAVATIGACLQMLTAWRFGALATFASLFAADLAGLWLYWRAHPLRLAGRFDRRELWRLTRIGVPIAILTLLSGANGLMVYLDRAILGTQAGLSVLGLYVFAYNLTKYLVAFLGDCILVYQPHLLERLATAADREAVYAWMAKPSLAMSYVAAIAGSCMLTILPLLITMVVPNYRAVIPLLPIFFTSALITCFYYLPASLLYSAFADQQLYYTKVWAAAVAAFAATLWVFVRAGWGVAGAAWASVIASTCVAVPTVLRAYRFYFSDWRRASRHAMDQLLPLGYVIAVHTIAMMVRRSFGHGSTTGWIEELLFAGMTGVVSCVPLIMAADSIFGLRHGILANGLLAALRLRPIPAADCPSSAA